MHLKPGLILREQNERMRSVTLLLCVLINLIFPPALFAQANPSPKASSTTASGASTSTNSSSVNKKNVVRNFKANLDQYSAFGNDCSKKPQGDSNCDTLINEFDLSIWEIEFKSQNSFKRSDFNSDGAVTLLDYGIWRNTYYPQKLSLTSTACEETQGSSIATLLHCFIAKAQIGFFQQWNNGTMEQFFPAAHAQTTSGGNIVDASFTAVSDSGSALVVNYIGGNNTQVLCLDDSPSCCKKSNFGILKTRIFTKLTNQLPGQ